MTKIEFFAEIFAKKYSSPLGSRDQFKFKRLKFKAHLLSDEQYYAKPGSAN